MYRSKLWAVVSAVIGAAIAAPVAPSAGQGTTPATVTFEKDVLPILQTSCQECHRPEMSAPMSLLTYEDARPWARSIRQKVSERAMPPWFSNRAVGEYQSDPSLSDAQIATIVKWVDSGSPKGNPADAPPPLQWAASGQWRYGKPDLVLTSSPVAIPAAGADSYPEPVFPTGLTEDRYIKSIEILPEHARLIHHILAYAMEAKDSADATIGDQDGTRGLGTMLANLARGGTPRMWPEGTAKLLRKGSSIRLQIHTHPDGEKADVEHTRIGITFFPRGYKPEHIITTVPISSPGTLAIPPGVTNATSDAYFTLPRPTVIISYQTHMHYRGVRQTLEAVLPSGETKLLSDVDRFNPMWQPTYRYKNPPILPRGTVLHLVSYFDNSAGNRLNPDPTAFLAWGERIVDEMNMAWMDWYYLTDAEFAAMQQKAAMAPSSPAGQGRVALQ